VSRANGIRIYPGDGDPRHGTENGYGNLSCRCVACTGAHADYCAWLQSRRAGTLAPDDPRHGTDNGYSNYECRCAPCTAAHTSRRANWVAGRRSRAGAS
jgi:hypothetical protein